MPHLYAVYLGGYAPNCNLELHDMVFVAAENFEEARPALVEKWFLGSYERFHCDGYVQLDVVDGHAVRLCSEPHEGDLRLYYVHLGGYAPGRLDELHHNVFLVASDAATAKRRAREAWRLSDDPVTPHKDVQRDVENCIRVEAVDDLYVHLVPSDAQESEVQGQGYNLFPRELLPG